jgi:hypothetical protein
MDRELIAPCGIYCGLCSSYLACVNKVPRKGGKFTYCAGCRPRDKQCAFLKKQCERLQKHAVQYCFECPTYPCERLEHVAGLYRTKYGLDIVQNLELIRDQGEDAVLEILYDRYACRRCGGLRSVHSGKCFECDEIKSWKD